MRVENKAFHVMLWMLAVAVLPLEVRACSQAYGAPKSKPQTICQFLAPRDLVGVGRVTQVVGSADMHTGPCSGRPGVSGPGWWVHITVNEIYSGVVQDSTIVVHIPMMRLAGPAIGSQILFWCDYRCQNGWRLFGNYVRSDHLDLKALRDCLLASNRGARFETLSRARGLALMQVDAVPPRQWGAPRRMTVHLLRSIIGASDDAPRLIDMLEPESLILEIEPGDSLLVPLDAPRKGAVLQLERVPGQYEVRTGTVVALQMPLDSLETALSRSGH